MKLLYKAVNPDLSSYHNLPWEIGSIVAHPFSTVMVRDEPATYLSLSAEPAETLIGRRWPARLLRVEPLGEVMTSDEYPHKRCVLSARVVDEIEAWQVFGPNGEAVVALIKRVSRLTADEVHRLAAWGAAWGAAWDAVRDAAWYAARDAAWIAAWCAAWDAARDVDRYAAWCAAGDAAGDAAWDAAWDVAGNAARAAGALVVRDLISDEHFKTLTVPWVSVMGPL